MRAYFSLSIHFTTFPNAPSPSAETTSSGKDRQIFIWITSAVQSRALLKHSKTHFLQLLTCHKHI